MFFAIINLHIDHLTIGRWTATWVLPGDARIWSFLGHPGQEFLLDFLLDARVKDSLPGQGWILLLHRGKNNHGTDNLTHPFKKRPPQMGLFFPTFLEPFIVLEEWAKNKCTTKWIIVQAATRDHSGDYSCSGLFGFPKSIISQLNQLELLLSEEEKITVVFALMIYA